MDLDTLFDAASFSPESIQPPGAWVGHLPLAAWVIRQVAPRILVELGTHTGNSYFSFCQSVVEAGLATKCYAVDTWQGDEHAGQYDENVFDEVNAHNEERYAEFSRLLRMTFDDALGHFQDESIELLHIDGLHTYEAARHDFEAWLPKLAPGAIVMFHDTGVRERNFGVWKLWEELQAQYPHAIEFSHSHGLGVLQLDNAPDGRRQEWLHLDVSKRDRLRTYFAALGSRQLERFELKSELSTSKTEVAARDVVIADLRQHASNLGHEMGACDVVIADLRQHASNLTQVVAARDAEIADLRQHAANLIQVVAARDVEIADLRLHASNLTQEVSARDVVIGELRQHVSNLELEMAERGARIEHFGKAVAERDGLIGALAWDVHALRQSTSWRITGPLRWVAARVKRRNAPASTVLRMDK
jgi:hypothetical protein